MMIVCLGPATWRDLQHALLLRRELPSEWTSKHVPLWRVLARIR
jgi:hypothetical protein